MSLKHIEIAAEVKVMISYIALTKATITSWKKKKLEETAKNGF